MGIVFDTRRYGRMRVESVPSTEHQYLQDFENRGGIRIHMNRDGKYGTIEMAVKPTAEQKKKLRSFINAVGGNVDIDFMDENYNTTHAVSYEGVSPTRALSGITTFYDKGIKPKGNESYSISRDEIVSIAESEGTVSYSIVRDEAKIAELEASPKRIGYRNMVLNEDGTLSAPMASSLSYPSRKKDTEIKMAVSELGKWEQADEHPELVNEKGKVTIYQPENGAGTTVNYDPYIHSRQDRVNTQLKGAWRRPNLVYVEVEIPTTDLESGYQADKAALPVGAHEWAGGSGIVMLSMYDKPVRIADWNDVADDWMKRFGNEPIHFDIIPPQLLPILAERGANISSPHTGLGVDVYKAYDKFKAEQGESYSVNRDDKLKAVNFQGNPINEDGSLRVDEISSIEDIKDKDFTSPYRNVMLPPIAEELSEAIGANGKRVVIKKNIFEKIKSDHKELTPQKSREILRDVFWATNLYGQNQKISRPYNWILIHLDSKNASVVVEVNNNKEFVEVVNWHYLDNDALNRKKRQAEKEGGRILTLASAAANTLNDLSSTDKDTTTNPKNQISEQESLSINRDDIATAEMDAEANEKLTESQKAAKAIADEIEKRIQKIAEKKELTFEQIELPSPIVGYRKQYLWGYMISTPLSDMKQTTLLYPYVSTWVSKTIPLYL